nr:hypothetical protein [Tanacetum cinerariifolium]
MDTCKALTIRVEHLELDKVAQAMEITKLKRRVKKLERGNKVKVLKLRRLQNVGTTQRVETSDETVMDDVSNQERMIADMDADADVVLEEAKEVIDDDKDGQNANIQGRTAETQAEIYKIDLDHANKVLSMQVDETKHAEVQELVEVVTTAKLITEVVTTTNKTITAASININVVKAQVPAAATAAPLRLTAAPRRTKGVVIMDPKKTTTTSTIIHTEAKSKDKGKGILTEAQARKNMIVYLKNVVGFKMDYFNGISYNDIRLIFEAKFNLNVAFLQKTREEIEEKESRALKMINKTPIERATKRQKLDEEVEELKRHLQIVPNEDDDVYTEATPLARKLILLVERKYPLTKFTLDQMLNAIRLEVEKESEVSLELLRNSKEKHAKCLMLLVKDLVLPSKDNDVD